MCQIFGNQSLFFPSQKRTHQEEGEEVRQDSHSQEGEGGRGEGGEDHLGEGAGPCCHGEGEEVLRVG